MGFMHFAVTCCPQNGFVQLANFAIVEFSVNKSCRTRQYDQSFTRYVVVKELPTKLFLCETSAPISRLPLEGALFEVTVIEA